jgi:hypothetical protein
LVRSRKRKSGCCPKNLFDLFDLAVKISSILVISQRFESKCCCPGAAPEGGRKGVYQNRDKSAQSAHGDTHHKGQKKRRHCFLRMWRQRLIITR